MDEDHTNLINDIFDEQERIHLQFKSIISSKKIDDLKILEIRFLHFLIISSLVFLFTMLFLNAHFIIFIINIIITLIYISYFNYIKYKYKKTYKLSKTHYKQIIKTRKKFKEISLFQYIFYAFIIIGTIAILIFVVINIDFGILIIIPCVSLIYVYLDFNDKY